MQNSNSKRKPKSTSVSIGPTDHHSQNFGFNSNLLLIFVTALTVLAFFGFNAFSSPIDLAANIFIDDSFLYLETAWQTSKNGFVTFDSTHPTNGVQFLWFVILVVGAVIAPSKIILLYIAYGVNLTIVAGIYVAIWRVGTLVGDRDRVLTMLMTIFLSVVLVDRQHFMFSGMESTAHMGALWLCLLTGFLAIIRCETLKRFPAKLFLLFTLGTILVTWARIDNALFSLALYCYVTINIFALSDNQKIDKIKFVIPSIIFLSIGALIQICFYYFTGGTILPISGLVKATGIGPQITVDFWGRFMSVVFPFAKPFDETNSIMLLLQAILFLALMWMVIQRAFRMRSSLRYLYGIAASLGVAIPVYAAIIAPTHHPDWRWYLAAVYLFYIIGVAALFYEVCGNIAIRFQDKRILAVISGISISLILIFVSFYSYRAFPHFIIRARVAQFLKETTDQNDIFAAFNAGQLAFFSDRRTINLDGLVNSKYYFDNILNKPEFLMEYLNKNNVRYIVDYDFYWARKVILENTVQKYSFEIKNDHGSHTLFVRELARR